MWKRDNNELRYNALMLLPKDGNPNYYKMLFRSAKNFFFGMRRPDLVEDLDYLIYEMIEKPMGTNINVFLMVYKNQPHLTAFTRSTNPAYQFVDIRKYTQQDWLDKIEEWIFKNVIELEEEIRFTLPAKTYI